MASYFNLILDTTAPSGLTLQINNGDTYCTSASVVLTISATDSDTSQMKIWGINGVASESVASWETYATSKTVTLPSGDGLKTIYIKVRDDVGNESSSVSANITLNTAVPVTTITGPDVSKISQVDGYNVASLSFVCDVAFTEYKVKVVPSTSSLESAGTVIGTTNGSTNTSGTGSYEAKTAINVTINGSDLAAASSGDGTKIIKVFCKNAAGTWSVA